MTPRLRRNELRRATEAAKSICVGCAFRAECEARRIAPPRGRQMWMEGE